MAAKQPSATGQRRKTARTAARGKAKSTRRTVNSPGRAVQVKLTFYPATAERWKDVEQLFGARGACGGCWCMVWRLPKREWLANKANSGAGNRRALKRIVDSGDAPGVLAYAGGEPIGWCAVAPRSVYVALERSRTLKPVDDRPVWSVSCLFIARAWRRQGVAAKLLDAAAKFARARGARIIEGYPVEPYSEKMPDVFAWTGLKSSFERAGFREVSRHAPARPILRRVLRG